MQTIHPLRTTRLLILVIVCMILVASIVHGAVTTITATGGNTVFSGAGFDTVSGNFSSTQIADSVFFALQQDNILTNTDLQGFLTLTYNLSGIPNLTVANAKRLNWTNVFCYSAQSTGTFSCSGVSGGTPRNPMVLFAINRSSNSFKSVYGYNATISTNATQVFSAPINPANASQYVAVGNTVNVSMEVDIDIVTIGEDAAWGIDYANLTIEYDLIPPIFTLLSPANNSFYGAGPVLFSINLTDEYAGVPMTGSIIITDPTNATSTQQLVIITTNGNTQLLGTNVTLPSLSGVYQFGFNYSDGVGNFNTTGLIFAVTVDATPPVLTIQYPTNILNWGNGTIAGTCSDTNLASFSWNGSTINHTIQNISVGPASWRLQANDTTPGPSNLTLTLTCTDTLNNSASDTRLYFFDLESPLCVNVPSPITLPSGSNHVWNVTCLDDSNLFLLNVTCMGGSEFNFYADNLNTTQYLFAQSAGTLLSDMLCTFQTADAHTKRAIRDQLRTETVRSQGSKIIMPHGQSLVSTTDGTFTRVSLDFATTDRIKPTYTFSGVRGTNVTVLFLVQGLTSVDYIENNAHSAWFVVDKTYWVDFDLPFGASYTVQYQNDTAWQVSITTTERVLPFSSIGIINTNIQQQQFYITPVGSLSADATLPVGQCPQNLNQTLIYITLLLFSLAFALFCMSMNIPLGTILAGLCIIAMSITTTRCELVIGMTLFLIGVVVTGLGFTMRKATDVIYG